jgi:hypothetical protein
MKTFDRTRAQSLASRGSAASADASEAELIARETCAKATEHTSSSPDRRAFLTGCEREERAVLVVHVVQLLENFLMP